MTPKQKAANAAGTAGFVIGTAFRVIPVAYAVATGTLPGWARWAMAISLALWAVMTIAKASR